MGVESAFGGRGRRKGPRGAARGLRVETLEPRELMAGNMISGYVYIDANGSGLFDPGEQPVAGRTIQLVNSSNAVVATTTTDGSGAYRFGPASVPGSSTPTTLTRTVTFPEAATNFTATGTVGKFDPTLGTLTSIDVIAVSTLTSRIQVESRDALPATVVGHVDGTVTTSGPGVASLTARPTTDRTFTAAAFDGALDFAGTSGKDFGAVQATDTKVATLTSPADLASYVGTGGVVFTTAANSNSFASGAGNLASVISSTASSAVNVVYHFTPIGGLPPGNYTLIKEGGPAGLDEGLASRNGVVLPESLGRAAIPVTLAGADLPFNNFGEHFSNSLSGFVYLDHDRDGLKDAVEFGVANVEVRLLGIDDAGGKVRESTKSGVDGSYGFANLRPGRYALAEVPVAVFQVGRATVGTQGGTAARGQITRIHLSPGESGSNNNFAELIRPDCDLTPLIRLIQQNKPLPTNLGPNIQRYLPGLVAYAQQHPRGVAGRFNP